jgi:hypothetical protein
MEVDYRPSQFSTKSGESDPLDRARSLRWLRRRSRCGRPPRPAGQLRGRCHDYGDKELSLQLLRIHPAFSNRESTLICVSGFEYGDRLKSLHDFECEDFARLRAMWDPSDAESMSGIVTIDHEVDDLSGFVEVPYASLSPLNMSRTFRQIALLVVPFQVSPLLFAFVSPHTKMIVIGPAELACRSLLEAMIERTGLDFSVVNCTLTPGVECDETWACVSAARCHIGRSALAQFL